MRVLYHHRTQAEDGQAVHIRALITAFRDLGHPVCEVGLVAQADGRQASQPAGSTTAQGQALQKPLAGQRARWNWVGSVPRFARELLEHGYTWPAARRLRSAAREFHPELIYERYAFGNGGGVLAAKALGLPLFLEVNSPMVLELARTRGLSFPGLAARRERAIFRAADRVFCVTAVLADMLAADGVPKERLVVTPNGVDLARYADPMDPEARLRARRSLNLDRFAEGPVLGFVGYYRPWHRLDLALPCLLEAGLEQARLVLIGHGPARPELEQAAARLGVSERLHFVPSVPHEQIPALLPAFDVALLPAINPYASPLKLHEYMAAGIATVAPDQPNLREVLTPEHDALLVPPGDGDALRSAVLRLLRDPKFARRLGLAARATVERLDLTWSGNVRRIEAALAALHTSKGSKGQER
jgi:glycosyltransferase involved in cell wall biosynthesis